MDLEGIKSADLAVGDLFKDFFVVPDYQREYVWTTKEVERLLDDIQTEYARVGEAGRDYFIGTIVTNLDSTNKVYELIDGQQRITTLFVLLVALRDMLLELGDEAEAITRQLSDLSVDTSGNETRRHRVELQYEDSQNVLSGLAALRSEVPLDALPGETVSARNLLQAYQDCRAFLNELGKGDQAELRKFYAYLIQGVKLIRIQTESVDRALWIFETINERGIGLDAMDLLKNLLFRAAKDDQFEKLKQRWKALVDALFLAKERPIGFIRYFLLANYAHHQIRTDGIYSWLTDRSNEDRPQYETNPVAFANELLSAARAYVNFAQGRHKDGTECPPLMNVRALSKASRQHLILLLAASHLPKESIHELSVEIERLLGVFILTRQQANRLEDVFVDWAVKLRDVSTDDELRAFLQDVLVPRRYALAREFVAAIQNLREENLPKYRLKYVLAKIAQYVDTVGTGAERQLSDYLSPKVDVEHILPLGASEELIEEFGGEEVAADCVHGLANLTLLERSLNAVVSNGSFPAKQEVYGKSAFFLTKGLGTDPRVGRDTMPNRALSLIGSFQSWTFSDFEVRQDLLSRLACRVWDVPIPE